MNINFIVRNEKTTKFHIEKKTYIEHNNVFFSFFDLFTFLSTLSSSEIESMKTNQDIVKIINTTDDNNIKISCFCTNFLKKDTTNSAEINFIFYENLQERITLPNTETMFKIIKDIKEYFLSNK